MKVNVEIHTTAALTPGKNPWYRFDRRQGGPENRSGCSAAAGKRTTASQPVARLYVRYLTVYNVEWWYDR
jgi:hypothetical protein